MVVEYVELGYLRWIVIPPLVVAALQAALVAVVRRELPRRVVAGLSIASLLLSLAFTGVALAALIRLEENAPLIDLLWTWIGGGIGREALSVEVAFHFDPLSAVLCLVVTGVGLLVQIFSIGYMASDDRQDAGYQRYFCYSSLAIASMLALVLAENLLLLLVSWMGVGLSSALLISFWYGDEESSRGGNTALVVDRIGDCGLVVAILVIFWQLSKLGTPDLSLRAIEASFHQIGALSLTAPGWLGGEWAVANTVALCLLVAACAKSAQFPLHVWCPESVAAPAPASALIHSITSLAAGAYLLCRFFYLYPAGSDASTVVAWVGGATALYAALIACVQVELLKVLAFSSMSQLGLIFVAVGCGNHTAAIFHLTTHAFFKSALFLGAAVVLQALRESDILRMGGMRVPMQWSCRSMTAAALALGGLFPLSGFFSLDQILIGVDAAAALPGNQVLHRVVLVVMMLSAFYMLRLIALIFWGEARAVPNFRSRVSDPPRWQRIPLMTLALLASIAGLLTPPQLWGDILIPGEGSSDSLANFLGPVFSTEGETAGLITRQWWLVAQGATATLLGFGLAMVMYWWRPDLPGVIARGVRPLHVALQKRLYLDALYEWLLLRPYQFLCDRLLYRTIEKRLIDGALVGGSTWLVRAVGGWGFKYAHSGMTQAYLVAILIGAVAIAIFLMH